MIFYHYTTEDGAKSIKQCQHINASLPKMDGSSGDGGRFGSGVYLTTVKPPCWLQLGSSKKEIAHINYGKGGETRLQQGRLDYYIEVDIPEDKVRKIKGETDYLYPRGKKQYPKDLDLRLFPHQIGKCDEWTGWNTLFAVGAVAILGIVASSKIQEMQRQQPQHGQLVRGHQQPLTGSRCDGMLWK